MDAMPDPYGTVPGMFDAMDMGGPPHAPQDNNQVAAWYDTDL